MPTNHANINFLLTYLIGGKLFSVKVKKIGGSVALMMKKENAKELNLKENEKLLIDFHMENPLKELFGSGKFSKPTKQLIAEVRRKESKYW